MSKNTGAQQVSQGVEYIKRVGAVTNEADRELWGLIVDVPRLNSIWPYVCAILNVGLAGSGTILAGCLCDSGWSKTQMFVGFIQMLTSVYIIGWVASLYWAYLLVQKALRDKQEVQEFLSKTNPKSDQPM